MCLMACVMTFPGTDSRVPSDPAVAWWESIVT